MWIIYSKEEKKYEIDKWNHQDWFNKGPWYNTDIYSRFHGSLVEYLITHARTDRYNIMCYLLHMIENLLMKMKKVVLEIG